jgi:rRNA maturation RNase YbeY
MVIKYNGYFYLYEKKRLERAADVFLNYFKIRKGINFHLASIGKDEISKENMMAFNKNEVTDVVTLPIYSNFKELCSEKNTDGFAGDILIYRPEIRKNALAFSKTIIEELELVVIHGMLHLFGFAHKNEKITKTKL